MRYIPSFPRTAGLLVAWACCLVAAGHGIAPLGLLVLVGVAGWPALGSVAWVGIALVLIAQRLRWRAAYATGLAALGVAWSTAFALAEVRWMLVLTSAPFLGLLFVLLRTVIAGDEAGGAGAAARRRAAR